MSPAPRNKKADEEETAQDEVRIGHTVELKDTPQIRGMVHRVRHLVKTDD